MIHRLLSRVCPTVSSAARSVLGTVALFVAAPAWAQVSSALVAVPWAPGQTLSTTAYAIGVGADTESNALAPGSDLTTARLVNFGRYRLDAQDPRSLTFGWLYDRTELNTGDPLLPERLEASAAAIGASLGDYKGWQLGFTAGGGFAGDLPYADEQAWYGVGSVFARKRLARPGTALTLILDYDGSRTFLPDVPLPGVQYSVRKSDTLSYAIGLPFSNLSWQPDEHWSVNVNFLFLIGGSAEVSYRVDDRWSGYFAYESSTRGFHLSGDDDNRRLFFQQSRAELGARFALTPELRLNAAIGYAFDQEFTRGFDTRNDTLVRDVEDAPFLRVGIKAAF